MSDTAPAATPAAAPQPAATPTAPAASAQPAPKVSTPVASIEDRKRQARERAERAMVDAQADIGQKKASDAAAASQPDHQSILAAAAQEAREARELKAKLKEREAEMSRRDRELAEIEALAKSDPVALMQRIGPENWYAQATDRMISELTSKPQKSEVEVLKEQLHELNTRIERQKYESQAQTYLNRLNATLADPKYAIIADDPTAMSELHRFIAWHAQEKGGFVEPTKLLDDLRESQIERLKRLASNAAWRDVVGDAGAQPPPPAVGQPQARSVPAPEVSTPSRAFPPAASDYNPLDKRQRRARALAMLAAARGHGGEQR